MHPSSDRLGVACMTREPCKEKERERERERLEQEKEREREKEKDAVPPSIHSRI